MDPFTAELLWKVNNRVQEPLTVPDQQFGFHRARTNNARGNEMTPAIANLSLATTDYHSDMVRS